MNKDVTGFTEGTLPEPGREIEYVLMGAIERGTVIDPGDKLDLNPAGDGVSIKHAGEQNVVHYFHRDSLIWRYPEEVVTATRPTTQQDTDTFDAIAKAIAVNSDAAPQEVVLKKSTGVSVKYDCGWNMGVTIPLGPTQTMLHQAAVGDLLISLADALHLQECGICAIAREEEGG